MLVRRAFAEEIFQHRKIYISVNITLLRKEMTNFAKITKKEK